MAVVVLDHVAAGGGAGDDRAAAGGDEDRRAERLAARVLEHDLGVAPDEAADVLAQAAPLALVLVELVGPELVAGGLAVDHRVAAHRPQDVALVGRRHDADRRAAAVQDVLHRVAAEPAGRAPDEHRVALLHARRRAS